MGGGGSYFPGDPEELRKLVERARTRFEDQQLESEINELLQDQLVRLKQRDTDKIKNYLEEVKEILGEEYEVEHFLFGGSVAKHTYVDGLSDIDALCILNREDLSGESPGQVLNSFFELLEANLPVNLVKKVEKGKMAVTVTYQDETEIQLLPALRTRNEVAISNSTGNNWKNINPKAFQEDLTAANEKMSRLLVPTIKFAKSIMDSFPERQRLEGYHTEALALGKVHGQFQKTRNFVNSKQC